MSKTYRDVIRGKYRHADKLFDMWAWEKKLEKCYTYRGPLREMELQDMDVIYVWRDVLKCCFRNKTPWDMLTYDEKVKVFPGFSKNPAWWNRLFHTKPNRRRDRILLRKYDCHIDAESDAEFSLPHKPNKYYW
jgi:hypothetical protein